MGVTVRFQIERLLFDRNEPTDPVGLELIDVFPGDERAHRSAHNGHIVEVPRVKEGLEIACIDRQCMAGIGRGRPTLATEIERNYLERQS